MTALGSDAHQALAPDWTGALIVGVPLTAAGLAVATWLYWGQVSALARFWWCKRAPMTTRSAQRAKARARAEEPDPGPGLGDDERFAWRRAVAAYFTPTDHQDYADAFEADRPARCPRLAWRDEVPAWRRAAEGLLGRQEPYPVRPGQYNDEPDEEFLP